MLDYNQVKERSYIIYNGEPHEVIYSHVHRKQQAKPTNQVKMRNLITGSQNETVYRSSDKVDEAEISKKKVQYIFNKFNKQSKEEEFWFNEPNNPQNRFMIPAPLVEDKIKFIKPNDVIDVMIWTDPEGEEHEIGIDLPKKVELEVKEAPPAVKGNTATGATKQITLETGLVVNAPLFIETGDVVRVNTETGEYTERA